MCGVYVGDVPLVTVTFFEQSGPVSFHLVHDGAVARMSVENAHGHTEKMFLARGTEESCAFTGKLVQENLPISPIKIHRDEIFGMSDGSDGVIASASRIRESSSNRVEHAVGHT